VTVGQLLAKEIVSAQRIIIHKINRKEMLKEKDSKIKVVAYDSSAVEELTKR